MLPVLGEVCALRLGLQLGTLSDLRQEGGAEAEVRKNDLSKDGARHR